MKLTAGLPLVFVLISLCGSSVPASDSTVSGALYFDENRNGVQDSCDSALASRTMALTRDDGQTYEAATNAAGGFHFEGVEAGDYTLSPLETGTHAWPVTTELEPIGLTGLDDVEGLVVGVATSQSIDVTTTRVIGFVFEDVNANGALDQGECGFAESRVVPRDAPGVEPGTQSRGAFSFTVDGQRPVAVQAVPPSGNEVFWTQTFPPSTGNCLTDVMPVARYGDNIYEAIIGLSPAVGEGRLGGYVFNDQNSNGARDEGEGGHEYVVTLAPNCPNDHAPRAIQTNSNNGEYFFNYLVPGSYTVSTGDGARLIAQGDPPPVQSSYAHVATTPLSAPVDVGDALVEVNFGFREIQPATLLVKPFDDLNGDGIRSDAEPTAWRLRACLTPLDGTPYAPCAAPFLNGVATFAPLHPGGYRLTLSDLYDSTLLHEAEIDVAEGEERAYVVPVSLPPYLKVPFDRSLATPVEWAVCASDPSWIQPPFESIEELPPTTLGEWDIERAQTVYAHHRYTSGGYATDIPKPLPFFMGDVNFWCPLLSDNDPWGITQFHFINYQPTAVYENADTLEIHVTPTTSGWWSVRAAYDTYASQPRAVFTVNDVTGEVAPACQVYGCYNNLYQGADGAFDGVSR